jgi:hypothetical protein
MKVKSNLIKGREIINKYSCTGRVLDQSLWSQKANQTVIWTGENWSVVSWWASNPKTPFAGCTPLIPTRKLDSLCSLFLYGA